MGKMSKKKSLPYKPWSIKRYPIERPDKNEDLPGPSMPTQDLPEVGHKVKLLKRESEVEQIVARQVKDAKTKEIKYEVKWKGYETTNWELSQVMFKCKPLIVQFEKLLNANRRPIRGRSMEGRPTRTKITQGIKQPPYQIKAVGKKNGEVHFKIKWNEADISDDIIPTQGVNEYWPEMVREFYRERIKWTPIMGKEDKGKEEERKIHGNYADFGTQTDFLLIDKVLEISVMADEDFE